MKKIVSILLCVGLILLFVSTVSSQPSLSLVGATNTDRAINYNNGPCIDRAPNGTVMCIWAKSNTVVWTTYDDLFGVWNPTQSLGSGNGDDTTPTLIADNNSHFHATWSEANRIYYAQYDGLQWSTPIQVQKNAFNSNKNSIIIDSNDMIWIAWCTYAQSNNQWLFISHSTDNGATWSDPDTLAKDMHPKTISSTYVVPHLAASAHGKVGVVYREKDTDLSLNYQLFFQEYDGGQWSDPEVITDFHTSVGCYQASLAYDLLGTRHAVFYTNETDWPNVNQGQIYYTAKPEGGQWSAPVAITSDPNGKADYPAITIGSNQAFYVAHLQNSYATGSAVLQVFVITSNDRGATWNAETQLSTSNAALPLRGPSIGKHPQPAGVGGTMFEGGADVLWIQPDAGVTGGNAVMYGRIPWIETVGVALESKDELPTACNLCQNYPNPFNPETTIEFHLTKKAQVALRVYNLLGEEVATLFEGELFAGVHHASFNINEMPNGIYFYKIIAGNFVAVKKMVCAK